MELEHPISKKVKRADLEDNMDLTRLERLSEEDKPRLEKYHREWRRLSDASPR